MLQVSSQKFTSLKLLSSLFAVALLAMFWLGCSKPADSQKTADASKTSDKAEKSSTPSTSGKNLDTGRKVLEAMAEAYRSAKSYNDKGKIRFTAKMGDQNINQQIDLSIAFERPNKLRMEAYLAKVVIDGKKFYASIANLPGQVLVKDAPSELTMKSIYSDRILAPELSNELFGAPPQLTLLLNDKAVESLLSDAEEPRLAEPGEIDGREYYRVQFRRFGSLTVMWIDKETLVLRRMILPTDDVRRQLANNGSGAGRFAFACGRVYRRSVESFRRSASF